MVLTTSGTPLAAPEWDVVVCNDALVAASMAFTAAAAAGGTGGATPASGRCLAPPTTLVVAQREVAFVRCPKAGTPDETSRSSGEGSGVGQAPTYIMSEDATTCCIMAAYAVPPAGVSGAPVAMLTHIDGDDVIPFIHGLFDTLVQRFQAAGAPASAAGAGASGAATSGAGSGSGAGGAGAGSSSSSEPELHVLLAGSYDDERGTSLEIVDAVLECLHSYARPLSLDLAACLNINTQPGSEPALPKATSLCLNLATWEATPSMLPDRSLMPDRILRGTRAFAGEQTFLDVYDTDNNELAIPPFMYEPFDPEQRWLLMLDDESLLGATSTSPMAEGPYFAMETRQTIQFMYEHADWRAHWADDQPRRYVLQRVGETAGKSGAGAGGGADASGAGAGGAGAGAGAGGGASGSTTSSETATTGCNWRWERKRPPVAPTKPGEEAASATSAAPAAATGGEASLES